MIFFLYLFFVFFLGAAVGSFLNVVIFRLKDNKNIVLSRSQCMQCEKELGFLDLFPIFSFIFLKGKCRYCKSRIAIQYPIVEFATAALFTLIFSQFGGLDFAQNFDVSELSEILVLWVYVSILIVVFVYDLKHFIIPDKVLLPGVILVVLGSLLLFGDAVHMAFIGSFVYGFFMLSLFSISGGRWLGGGDVKLAFVVGLMLGWPNIVSVFFITFVGGSVVALYLLFFKKKQLGDKIPLGTFMTAGAVFGFFIAEPLMRWYLEQLGF